MDKRSETNAIMLDQCAAGDSRSWETFVRYYQPMIERWCRGRGLSESTALDIVQETLISVHRSLRSFESTPGAGAFRAWLKTIVFRRILDYRRRLRTQFEGQGGSTILRSLLAVAEAASKSDCRSITASSRLQAAVQEVAQLHTTRAWKVFLRSVIDNRSTEQVAEEFAMTPAAVRQVRSRILRQLRSCLQKLDSNDNHLSQR
jgi:RNA polymerase sigma-70 factor, ECF subfamily